MSLLVFAIVLLALFGPKVGGFLDLSVTGGLLGFLLLAKCKEIRFEQEYAVAVALVAAVLAYSTIAVVLSGSVDLQPFLRHFRALLSTIFLGLFFYNVGRSGALTAAALKRVIVGVLLINAIVVLMSVLNLNIQYVLADLYGFNKTVRPLRSFGLTAGYDTAGYLCVVGALITAISLYFRKSRGEVIALAAFVSAALFTSRSSMVLTALLIATFCVFFLFKGRWMLKLVSAVYLTLGAYVAILYVVPLIVSSFGWGMIVPGDADYSGSFASTDLAAWIATMWRLPDTTVEILFGTGLIIHTSDVGYIELIYMIGIFGLFLVASLHFYLLFVVVRMRSSAKNGVWIPDTQTWVLLLSLMFLILGLFIINIKNLYFMTRGFHELIVIMFFYLAGVRRATSNEAVEVSDRSARVATIAG